jgi:hypothetical protein
MKTNKDNGSRIQKSRHLNDCGSFGCLNYFCPKYRNDGVDRKSLVSGSVISTFLQRVV